VFSVFEKYEQINKLAARQKQKGTYNE